MMSSMLAVVATFAALSQAILPSWGELGAADDDDSLCLAQTRARMLERRPPTSSDAGTLSASIPNSAHSSLLEEQQAPPPYTGPTISPPAPSPVSSLGVNFSSPTTAAPLEDAQEAAAMTTLVPATARGWDADKEYEMQYGVPPPDSNSSKEYNEEYQAAVMGMKTTTASPLGANASANASANLSEEIPSPAVKPAVTATAYEQEVEYEASKDCQVGFWTEWSGCSGGSKAFFRSRRQTRYRPIVNPHYLGGLPCLPRTQSRPCLDSASAARLMDADYAAAEAGGSMSSIKGYGSAVSAGVKKDFGGKTPCPPPGAAHAPHMR